MLTFIQFLRSAVLGICYLNLCFIYVGVKDRRTISKGLLLYCQTASRDMDVKKRGSQISLNPKIWKMMFSFFVMSICSSTNENRSEYMYGPSGNNDLIN